jgi:hypothetical protein
MIQSVLPRKYFTSSHGAKFMISPFPIVFARSAATVRVSVVLRVLLLPLLLLLPMLAAPVLRKLSQRQFNFQILRTYCLLIRLRGAY